MRIKNTFVSSTISRSLGHQTSFSKPCVSRANNNYCQRFQWAEVTVKMCQNFLTLNSKPFPSLEFMDASTTASCSRMTPDWLIDWMIDSEDPSCHCISLHNDFSFKRLCEFYCRDWSCWAIVAATPSVVCWARRHYGYKKITTISPALLFLWVLMEQGLGTEGENGIWKGKWKEAVRKACHF